MKNKQNQGKKGEKNKENAAKQTAAAKKIKKKDAEQILKSVQDRQKNNKKYIKHRESVPGGNIGKQW